jgi:hypothetical protein
VKIVTKARSPRQHVSGFERTLVIVEVLPVLASNRTRRIDFALFMVHALEDDALVQEAPAIVGGATPSAQRFREGGGRS